MILAGAGSGKTRVLTHRIAHLVGTRQAQPSEILAITFTNKAAQEMRERVETLVGGQARRMWVMTFHSACARMLRSDAERLGYTRGFTIYDQADSLRLVKQCVDELDVDPKRFPPRGIQRQISDAKNQLLDAEAYRLKVSSFFEQTAADVYELYEQRIHSMNAMDFDDLLFRCVNLFELFPEVRDRYRHSFQHVLVDEYQDTNRAQYEWLRLLAEEHRNLTVVGDDDQSIYAFRGADIRNILDFEDDYPDAHVVKLEQNYRSTQTILSAANAVISNNRARKAKALWSDLGEGDPVHIRELDDEHAEARFVVSEIERLVDEGASRDEVAVFYRANAQSRVLEDMLVRYGVTYQVIGGTRFYERAEIKDALAYLTLLVNPQDTVAFQRAVNSPRRGIGNTSQARIVGHANTLGESVFDVAAAPENVPGPRAGGGQGRGPLHVGDGTAARARRGRRRVGDLLQETLDETGYLEALQAERTIEAQGRLENLEELVGVAREFDTTAEEPTVEEFLQQLALFSEQDALDRRRRHRHADDHAQRQGARVPGGVRDRLRGRGVPALALDRGRRPRGGAPALLRRHHARQARALHDPRAHAAPLRRARLEPAQPLPRGDPGGAHRPRGGGAGGGPAVARGRPRRSRGASFALGDDVVHANFGEGVVIGVDQGGMVVVRFAADGSERKLMADYAPLKKVS